MARLTEAERKAAEAAWEAAAEYVTEKIHETPAYEEEIKAHNPYAEDFYDELCDAREAGWDEGYAAHQLYVSNVNKSFETPVPSNPWQRR